MLLLAFFGQYYCLLNYWLTDRSGDSFKQYFVVLFPCGSGLIWIEYSLEQYSVVQSNYLARMDDCHILHLVLLKADTLYRQIFLYILIMLSPKDTHL